MVPWAHFVGQLGRGHFGVSGHNWIVVAGSAFFLAVLCTVRFVGPNYKNQEGLAPDVVGASVVWPQFRFFPGRPKLAWGRGPRFQAGARVLDRTGTDKGWYSKA